MEGEAEGELLAALLIRGGQKEHVLGPDAALSRKLGTSYHSATFGSKSRTCVNLHDEPN